jgi:hypothetical protein
MNARWLAGLAALMALLAAGSASAFCRATTCDPESEVCATDAQGCLKDGQEVFWASSCITVSVQAAGAPKHGIDFDATRRSVERAFESWMGASCPEGGSPSIQVVVDGPISCDESEYSSDKRNANIVMLREDAWPYAKASPDVLGFTRLRFNPDTGELYDADIELNAVTEPLSAEDQPDDAHVDLESLITHEAGHLLGLDHTRSEGATMEAGYEKGSIELRSLEADDVEGLCTIYPPSRQTATDSCEPRHGYSDQCAADQTEEPIDEPPGDTDDEATASEGCSVAPGSRPLAPLGLLLLVAALWAGRLAGRKAAA